MKKLLTILLGFVILTACAPDKAKVISQDSIDGQINSILLKTPLEQERVIKGKAIYELKCEACHDLADERLVGPGWNGITKRRNPEWIMNMILNQDTMLNNDPEAKKLLELCLMRMPSQSVSVSDARNILAFMRQNDGEK